MRTLLLSFLLFGLSAGFSSPSLALTMYSDAVGTDVTFSDLQEETNTPGDPATLYGAPSVFGNALLFTPVNFISTASGGASDQTIGTFQGLITAKNKASGGITQLMLSETGDYGLSGGGTNLTNASVVAGLFIQIIEVNVGGSLVSDILTANDTFSFSANTPDASGAWSGSALIDIASAVQAEFGNGAFATALRFTFDNALSTNSETNTTAFIQKKDAVLSLEVVPEPGTLSLLALGIAAVAVGRRQR